MPAKKYMEHVVIIRCSVGLPGTNYHLKGKYSQVFYVFDLGITCQLEMFSLGKIIEFLKNRTTICQGFTLVQKQTTSLFSDTAVYPLKRQARNNYKICCCKILSYLISRQVLASPDSVNTYQVNSKLDISSSVASQVLFIQQEVPWVSI